MLETIFDQKSAVELLSHEILSKGKEIKRDSKIKVKLNPIKKTVK